MNIQFTGDLQFRTPISKKEKELYSELIQDIGRAMATGHLSSLYFLEDVIDRRKLQNEFVCNQTFLDHEDQTKRNYQMPINSSSFTFDQSGNILSLDIEQITPIESSCIYLSFNLDIFRTEVIRSMMKNDISNILKTSPIFWEVWNNFIH